MEKNILFSKIKKYSSRRWLLRNVKDPYIKLTDKEGYKSRSAYKLIEINKKFHILKKNSNILELGSSPGGWSQVLSNELGNNAPQSIVVAVDIKQMETIENIHFIHGDFLDLSVQNKIKTIFFNENSSPCELNLILSDIAPNFSGNKHIDQLKMMNIFENIIQYSLNMLSVKGNLVIKIFHSSIDTNSKKLLKENFQQVKFFKPKSSRKESEEIYLIALNKK